MSTNSSFRKTRIDSRFPYDPFPDEAVEQSIPERFEQQVIRWPDRLAVRSPEQSFTYDELNRTANRLARRILSVRGQGAEPIALVFEHGASILAAMLAVLKSGKFYVILDPTYPRDRLTYMLADSGAQLLIVDSKNQRLAQELDRKSQTLVYPDDLDDGKSSENLQVRYSPDDLALLVYTSGSTGNPKGAMHTHQSVLVEVRNLTTPGASARRTAGCCTRP